MVKGYLMLMANLWYEGSQAARMYWVRQDHSSLSSNTASQPSFPLYRLQISSLNCNGEISQGCALNGQDGSHVGGLGCPKLVRNGIRGLAEQQYEPSPPMRAKHCWPSTNEHEEHWAPVLTCRPGCDRTSRVSQGPPGTPCSRYIQTLPSSSSRPMRAE